MNLTKEQAEKIVSEINDLIDDKVAEAVRRLDPEYYDDGYSQEWKIKSRLVNLLCGEPANGTS